MIRILKPALLPCLLAAVLCGCQSKGGRYEPPAPDRGELGFRFGGLSATVYRPFQETWDTILGLASGAMFDVQRVDEDSGTIVLSFGGSDPGEFIDCGRFTLSSLKYTFNGEFVDFLRRQRSAALAGTLVVRMTKEAERRIEVTANAVFELSARGHRWTFGSGMRATVSPRPTGFLDGPPTYVLVSTGKAEDALRRALESLGAEPW